MNIRRINLWAGPGAAKSTIAAGLFYNLKMLGINCDLAREYIKNWAWLDRPAESFDQVYVFAKQLKTEDNVLRHPSKPLIISDCPLMLNTAYAKTNNLPFTQSLIDIAQDFEKQYPSLNIFIDRADRPFKSEGRWGTLKEAKEMDKFIIQFAEEQNILMYSFRYDDIDGILKFLKNVKYKGEPVL